MEISPGDTFLYKAQENKKHLHIVVEKVISDDIVVCAFVSSIKPGKGYDKSCVLTAEDSLFLNRDSYVVYDKMRLYKISSIQDMINRSEAKYEGRLDDSVLKRIIDGALKSKMTNNNIRRFIIEANNKNS